MYDRGRRSDLEGEVEAERVAYLRPGDGTNPSPCLRPGCGDEDACGIREGRSPVAPGLGGYWGGAKDSNGEVTMGFICDAVWLYLFGRRRATRSGSSASRLKLISRSAPWVGDGKAHGLRHGVLVTGPLLLPTTEDSWGPSKPLVSRLGATLSSTTRLFAQSSPIVRRMRSRLSLALERSKEALAFSTAMLVKPETALSLASGPP